MLLLQLLLLCPRLSNFVTASSLTLAQEPVEVEVYRGPSVREQTRCPPKVRVNKKDYVTLHYNATIDKSSATGKKGLLVDSTHKEHTDYPEPIMLHMGDNDPMLGWTKGLLGLCSGDYVYLVVPPKLAYGDEGDGGDIPGGATLKLDIEIVTVHANPQMHYRYLQGAERMFREMDSDGDGKVTMEEMEIYLNVPEDYPNRESYIRQHFQLSDYNKDGTVSVEEFKFILASFQGIDEL